MFFANPLALYGLIALAVPILLHLERRRITRKLPFAFVDFLFEAQKHRFWSLKVQQLLLLFVRLLLVALVVLALAQLNVSAGGAGRLLDLFSGAPRAGVVLLVDVSPSMSATADGRTRLAAAREAAAAVLGSIDSESEILLLPFSDRLPETPPFFARNRAAVRGSLEGLAIFGESTDYVRAAEHAADRLRDFQAGSVFIVSDFQPAPTAALARASASLVERFPSVAFVLVPVPSIGDANLAVGETVLPQLPLLSGETGEALLGIAVWGARSAPGIVERWSVPNVPGASQETRFRPPEQSGHEIARHSFMLTAPVVPQATDVLARFSVEVEEGFDYPDAIAQDNTLEVQFPVLPPPRILVVGGDASGLPMRAYRALLAGGDAAPIVAEAEFVAAATFSDALAAEPEIVIVLEDASLPAAAADLLQAHLRAGRGLFVYAPGAGASPLLTGLGIELSGSAASASLEVVAAGDAFVRELSSVVSEGWARVEARGARALSGLSQPWLRAAAGDPLLGSKAVSGGRLLVSGVGLSLQRGNLVVSPEFLVLNQVACKYLLGAPESAAPTARRYAVALESNLAAAGPEVLEGLRQRGFGLLSGAGRELNAAPFDTGRYQSMTGLLLWLAAFLIVGETWLSNRV